MRTSYIAFAALAAFALTCRAETFKSEIALLEGELADLLL